MQVAYQTAPREREANALLKMAEPTHSSGTLRLRNTSNVWPRGAGTLAHTASLLRFPLRLEGIYHLRCQPRPSIARVGRCRI